MKDAGELFGSIKSLHFELLTYVDVFDLSSLSLKNSFTSASFSALILNALIK